VALHQVHPVKLATDVGAALVSNVLLWQHKALWGILVRLVPPLFGSALVMRFADLDRLRTTRRGRYVLAHMRASATALRLAGDVTMALGSWLRRPAVIGLGVVAILGGWSYGLVPSSTRRPH
jgi:hypothetical protein